MRWAFSLSALAATGEDLRLAAASALIVAISAASSLLNLISDWVRLASNAAWAISSICGLVSPFFSAMASSCLDRVTKLSSVSLPTHLCKSLS